MYCLSEGHSDFEYYLFLGDRGLSFRRGEAKAHPSTVHTFGIFVL